MLFSVYSTDLAVKHTVCCDRTSGTHTSLLCYLHLSEDVWVGGSFRVFEKPSLYIAYAGYVIFLCVWLNSYPYESQKIFHCFNMNASKKVRNKRNEILKKNLKITAVHYYVLYFIVKTLKYDKLKWSDISNFPSLGCITEPFFGFSQVHSFATRRSCCTYCRESVSYDDIDYVRRQKRSSTQERHGAHVLVI